ncbi:MAG: bifunctional riboflavin kinase/FAD synthetase [Bacteroidetes bacterium]|nr:bifunctional riboflavin kinase/FAD synthetase [Bacteroidota bacterium]
MQVYRSLEAVPHGTPIALTLGTFDGVHLGHGRIIERTMQAAREIEGRSLLLTFDPHPREVIGRKGEQTYLLTTIDERIELLRNTGLDACLVLPFTRDLSVLDASTFFQEYMLRRLHAAQVVVGVDHAFGKGREGNAEALRELGQRHGVSVTVVGELLMDGVKVSSTAVRNSLAEGKVRRAAAFLGRPYHIAGVVVRGEGIGGKLGYPTANIELSSPEKLLPRCGVYVVHAHFGGAVHEGIMNIGRRPTVSQQVHISLEVHIFTCSGDLYGMHLRVELLERLRDEIRFDSVAQLTAQIESDIIFAKEYLSRTQQRINK